MTKIEIMKSLVNDLRRGCYSEWSKDWEKDSGINASEAIASAIDFLECRIIEIEEVKNV